MENAISSNKFCFSSIFRARRSFLFVSVPIAPQVRHHLLLRIVRCTPISRSRVRRMGRETTVSMLFHMLTLFCARRSMPRAILYQHHHISSNSESCMDNAGLRGGAKLYSTKTFNGNFIDDVGGPEGFKRGFHHEDYQTEQQHQQSGYNKAPEQFYGAGIPMPHSLKVRTVGSLHFHLTVLYLSL